MALARQVPKIVPWCLLEDLESHVNSLNHNQIDIFETVALQLLLQLDNNQLDGTFLFSASAPSPTIKMNMYGIKSVDRALCLSKGTLQSNLLELREVLILCVCVRCSILASFICCCVRNRLAIHFTVLGKPEPDGTIANHRHWDICSVPVFEFSQNPPVFLFFTNNLLGPINEQIHFPILNMPHHSCPPECQDTHKNEMMTQRLTGLAFDSVSFNRPDEFSRDSLPAKTLNNVNFLGFLLIWKKKKPSSYYLRSTHLHGNSNLEVYDLVWFLMPVNRVSNMYMTSKGTHIKINKDSYNARVRLSKPPCSCNPIPAKQFSPLPHIPYFAHICHLASQTLLCLIKKPLGSVGFRVELVMHDFKGSMIKCICSCNRKKDTFMLVQKLLNSWDLFKKTGGRRVADKRFG
ncbi:hypothetical protein VP01_1542g3 [Puccinia sorghi]|uniref:Uncharacterized protein n=1 Tax=Puccinia sorghi TaxID=27349 RepID=A0A0L6VIH0_9BASI|nr:hypothetical protein VP01_1542g3 [Puccinia sorghi]